MKITQSRNQWGIDINDSKFERKMHYLQHFHPKQSHLNKPVFPQILGNFKYEII